MSKKQVKESLVTQLEAQGKTGEFYRDLVEDYMYYWNLKKELIADIKEKGIRYEAMNGNGIMVEKPNESIQNLQKTTATMLKILGDLNLKEPAAGSQGKDGYL